MHEIRFVLSRLDGRSADVLAMARVALYLQQNRSVELFYFTYCLLNALGVRCLESLPIAASERNLDEREIRVAGIGWLSSDRVVSAIVDNYMLEISRSLLSNGSHSTHVHDSRAVTVQTNHLTSRFAYCYAHSYRGCMSHTSHGQKVLFVTLFLRLSE